MMPVNCSATLRGHYHLCHCLIVTVKSLSSWSSWSGGPGSKLGKQTHMGRGMEEGRGWPLSPQLRWLQGSLWMRPRPLAWVYRHSEIGRYRAPRQEGACHQSPLQLRPEPDLLCFGGLMGTRPAPTGLYFHFLSHGVWTGLGPQLGPLGLRSVGEGMLGSLMGCGGRQESGMGPQACPLQGRLGGQTETTGPAPPPHPAACRPAHPRSRQWTC